MIYMVDFLGPVVEETIRQLKDKFFRED